MAAKVQKQSGAKRRKTGEAKRKATKQQGKAVPPDETKVRSGADGAQYWEGLGAWELTQGMTFRADFLSDLEAFNAIKKVIDSDPKAFSERLLSPALVTGAAMVVTTMEALEADAPPAESGAATDTEVAESAAVVLSVRDGIKRLAKGPRNAAVRRAFGLDTRLETSSPGSVLGGVRALLSGKREKPRSLAARSIIPADVKDLQQREAKLRRRVDENKIVVTATRIEHSRRAALHAGLELFYDRYAAAATRIFANDRLKRIEALSLVPRREERRGSGAKPEAAPAPAPAGQAPAGAGGSPVQK